MSNKKTRNIPKFQKKLHGFLSDEALRITKWEAIKVWLMAMGMVGAFASIVPVNALEIYYWETQTVIGPCETWVAWTVAATCSASTLGMAKSYCHTGVPNAICRSQTAPDCTLGYVDSYWTCYWPYPGHRTDTTYLYYNSSSTSCTTTYWTRYVSSCTPPACTYSFSYYTSPYCRPSWMRYGVGTKSTNYCTDNGDPGDYPCSFSWPTCSQPSGSCGTPTGHVNPLGTALIGTVLSNGTGRTLNGHMSALAWQIGITWNAAHSNAWSSAPTAPATSTISNPYYAGQTCVNNLNNSSSYNRCPVTLKAGSVNNGTLQSAAVDKWRNGHANSAVGAIGTVWTPTLISGGYIGTPSHQNAYTFTTP